MAATAFHSVTNNAASTLNASITDVATSIVLSSGGGATFPSAGSFWISIGDEIIEISSRATDTLTAATRGDQSTTASGHDAGATVSLFWTAEQVTELQDAINDIEDGTKTLTSVTTSGNGVIGGSFTAESGNFTFGTVAQGELHVITGNTNGNFHIYHSPASGAATIHLNPDGNAGSTSTVGMFRHTANAATDFCNFAMFVGDDTNTKQFEFRIGPTNPYFVCWDSGGTDIAFKVNSETGISEFGQGATVQGRLEINEGAGGNTPAYIRLSSPNSTDRYYFSSDSGVLRVHTSAPTATTDGSVVGGGGDVTKVSTPANNEIGVWTGDGTIEGDANFTWDGTTVLVNETSAVQAGDLFNLADSSATAIMRLSSYSATSTHVPSFTLQKSASASIGTFSATADTERLGQVVFQGVNSSSAVATGSFIRALQVGAAGATFIGGKLEFNTGDNTAGPAVTLTLDENGDLQGGTSFNIGTSGDTDLIGLAANAVTVNGTTTSDAFDSTSTTTPQYQTNVTGGHAITNISSGGSAWSAEVRFGWSGADKWYVGSGATTSYRLYDANNTTDVYSVTPGAAGVGVMAMTQRLTHRSVTDAGPMTATGGTQGEVVFNTSDSKFYGCTVTHATAATWAAFH